MSPIKEFDPREFYFHVGSRIRYERIKAGLTQAQVADHLNLTRASIGNIENGGRHQAVSLHAVYLCSRLFGCSVERLICGSDELDRQAG